MTIVKNKVVTIHYKLYEGDTLLEQSDAQEPMLYLHGHENTLPELEKAIEGKSQGDSVSVELPPEKGYGEYQEGAVERIPMKYLLEKKKWKVGDIAAVNTTEGPRDVRILKVGKFNVDIDPNHPYAGKTVRFEVEIEDVRDATSEELEHGHAHGVGGHQH